MNPTNRGSVDKLLDDAPVARAQVTYDKTAYPEASYTRNLLMVMADGNRKFFNYSYLITADYLKTEDFIRLEFTTHMVTLHGLQLESLFDALFEHRVRMIVCKDARYNVLDNGEEDVVVNGMEVVEK